MKNGIAYTDGMWKYDVMYTETAVDPADGITLKRASAMLRFQVTLPAGAPEIDNIYLSATDPVFYERLQLIFGDATAGTASVSLQGLDPVNTISLDVIHDVASESARTITAYMMTPAVSDFTGLLVKVSAVAADGTTYSYIYNLFADDAVASNNNLNEGYAYTFAPAATLEHDKWAGSNIYWDETAHTLTFDPPYEMKNALAQGVFFRWGSLVGISPALTNGSETWSGDEIIYVPTYSITGDVASVTWYADRASAYTQADYSLFNNIPYEDDTSLPSGSNVNSLDYASGAEAKWMAQKGDICRFVALHSSHSGTPYYMPTLDQFGTYTYGTTPDYAEILSSENLEFNSLGNAQGTANLIDGSLFYIYKQSAALPAPGMRDINGELKIVGFSSYYWSSSIGNIPNTTLSFSLQGGYYNDDPKYAQPIRCIRN
jgi:hypothetical protein